MSENNASGWSVKQEGERSIVLTSSEGEIRADHWEDKGSIQIWFVRFNLEGHEPVSWKVKTEDKDDLIDRSIPEILEQGFPTHDL